MGFHRKGPIVAKIKHHSLTGRITLPLMHLAFRNVRRNRGAAGIDRESIVAFEVNLADNLLALMRRLKDGSYKPLPLRRVRIPKGQGQTRPLGIPMVRAYCTPYQEPWGWSPCWRPDATGVGRSPGGNRRCRPAAYRATVTSTTGCASDAALASASAR
jgi:retron-type reverse transcriptase